MTSHFGATRGDFMQRQQGLAACSLDLQTQDFFSDGQLISLCEPRIIILIKTGHYRPFKFFFQKFRYSLNLKNASNLFF